MLREDPADIFLKLPSLGAIAKLYDHRAVSSTETVIPLIWPFRVSSLESELAYSCLKAGKAMMRWIGAQLQPGERFTFVGRLDLKTMPPTSDQSDYAIVGKYVIRNKSEAKDSDPNNNPPA